MITCATDMFTDVCHDGRVHGVAARCDRAVRFNAERVRGGGRRAGGWITCVMVVFAESLSTLSPIETCHASTRLLFCWTPLSL